MSTMQQTIPQSSAHRRNRRGRRLRWWLLGAGLVVVLLAVAGALAGTRLLHVLRAGERAQTELTAFKTALKGGNANQAGIELAAAKRDIGLAESSYRSPFVRVVGSVPVVGFAVHDTGHLLTAADDVARAGADALTLYDQVKGEHSKLFHNDTVDIARLKTVAASAATMVDLLTAAERELRSMHAASWEPKIPHARDKALVQVHTLRDTGVAARKFLSVLPPAVGADGPRTYLLVVLNPAELQGAGGSALNMTTVRFVRGHMKIEQSGATADLTVGNALIRWKHVPEDPWLHGPNNFGAADRSPDFRTSGAELMRAYAAQFHKRVDGIVALDPIAMQDLMPQIGSFTTPGFGVITSDNLAKTVLIDAYVKYTDPAVRRVYNQALLQTLMHSIVGGGHMLGKAKALEQAAKTGHLQVLVNDPALQAQAAQAHLTPTLPPSSGDVVGVYTTNTNASKVDVWQQRTVTEKAHVNADGSVSVVRTVTVKNAAPPYTGPGTDIGTGYLTRVSHPRITNYFNGSAKIVRWAGGSRMIRVHERGLLAVSVLAPTLGPGRAVTLVVKYKLPPGTAAQGDLPLEVAAQPTYLPVRLNMAVSSAGGCRATGTGWTVNGSSARLSIPLVPIGGSVKCAA